MRILFLNQYFPPDAAPTGALLAELAEACAAEGFQVALVSADQSYRTEGMPGGSRIRREFAALRSLWRKGVRSPRADVVISGSSPPCLAVVADRIAAKHRAVHLHWVMDLYPDLAVALGEIRREGLVHKVCRWFMRRAYLRARCVVALDADMQERLRGYSIDPAWIRPWVLRSTAEQLSSGLDARPDRSWSWVYSGNLGRAHDYETILRAQRVLEDRAVDARLILQGSGPGRRPAMELAVALGLQRCEWRDYVPADDLVRSLLAHRVLAVTQKCETKGMLWPSKLGLAMALPRYLLFIGPVDGTSAHEVRKREHGAVFAPGDALGVADWIESRHSEDDAFKALSDPRVERKASIQRWMDLIQSEGKLPRS